MIRLSAFADEASKDVAGQIAALKRNRIPYIELRGLDGVNIGKITLEQAKEYAALFEKEGIRVWAIGSPIGKIKIDDDFEAEKASLRHVCRLANLFGTDRIRMFSFFEAYEKEETVMKYLQEMVAIAEEEGCSLYHENEKLIFGDTLERVERIMEKVKGLKFIYDPANYIEAGEDAETTLNALHSRTHYFHIKDILADTHQIVPAGKGDGRIGDLVARIAPEAEVTLTLEPHLKLFDGYSGFDSTELKNKYEFATETESFDAAVCALKEILVQEGYKEVEGGWIK